MRPGPQHQVLNCVGGAQKVFASPAGVRRLGVRFKIDILPPHAQLFSSRELLTWQKFTAPTLQVLFTIDLAGRSSLTKVVSIEIHLKCIIG